MHVPRNTGRYYRVEVTPKPSLLDDGMVLFSSSVWEGKASCLTDAFNQARHDTDSRKLWTLFRCKLLEVRDP